MTALHESEDFLVCLETAYKILRRKKFLVKTLAARRLWVV